MKTKKENKFIKWVKSAESDIWLFVVAVVLLNLVCARAFFRIDLTATKAFSLSPSSKEVVKTLEEPLSIKVFFSGNLPAPYSNTDQYLKDILSEYKTAANSNFSYEFFDMDKPENQKLASNYGLNQVQIREVKNNEVGFKNAFMGLVLTYADQIEKLDGISSSDGLEYNLTTLISKIVSNTNALSGLSSNVTLTLYKSDALSAFGINGFDKIESVVQKSFEKANKKYQGRITFSKENPNSEEARALGERYGIQTVNWKNRDGTPGNGAIGLVLEYDEKFRVIPLQMQNMIFSYVIAGLDELDENIDASIQSIVSKTSTVAYITGHGELSLEDNQAGAANFNSILSDTYTLENVNLAEADIPVGTQNAIINGPKSSFTDEELYKLDQFVLKGGNLLIFSDSFDVIQPQGQQSYYQQPRYIPNSTGIEKLLSKYGMKTGEDYVMDEHCYTQNTQQYGKLNFYFVPMMQKNSLSQKNPISRNLGYVLFMQPSSIDISEAEANKDTKVTVLAKTSPKSWKMTENFVLNPLAIKAPVDKSTEKSENIAVLVEGKFESAFDKKPGNEEESKSENSLDAVTHLSKSSQNGKVLLISTSYVTTPQMLQENSGEPIALFLRNAVDYMNGNEDFCSMRTKNLSLNTLKTDMAKFANAIKYFNEIGLAVLVAAAGLLVLLARKRRREKIRMNYNPSDPRQSK